MSNGWPLLRADHGIHYHHGLLSRRFLLSTGTTAGYDPSFMSGFAMSIISDLSSTFSDLVMLPFADRPVLGYKIHVLGTAAVVPWLVGLGAMAWKARPLGVLLAVALYLVYFWTDWPCRYVGLGMLNYLLSVPVSLLAVAGLAAYCDRGGFVRWFWSLTACSAVLMIHITSPMLVGPAGLLAYLVAVFRFRREDRVFPASRHFGLWSMAPLILLVNVFWLWPGFLLWSTKGASELAFAHPEGVWKRLSEILWIEAPVQVVLIGFGAVGLAALARRELVGAVALGGYLAMGFGWGYLAGAFRSLDSLQPGRHTYACYTAACVASGIGLAEILARLRSTRNGRLDVWLGFSLLLLAIRVFGPTLEDSFRLRLSQAAPFLSSRPHPSFQWIVNKVREHVKPGERLYFEETGIGRAIGLVDPFQTGHCSPVLPQLTGVEVIGGPFLHSTVTTNFTQFGEKKLFEKTNWDRDFFVRYARLYRPSAICCWSPGARAFCLSNPDLIRVVDDDGLLLLGRVIGFEGSTIRGTATVEAGPNRLVVRDAVADERSQGDGLVVLRYHAVPYLKATPPVEIEKVFLEEDPIPFIGLRPSLGPITIEMVLPPRK